MKRLALIALAACGPASTSSVVEVPPPQELPQPQQQQVAPTPVAAAALMNAGEQWIGRYVCAQGETDLDLHIDHVMGDTIDATFEFSHGPSGAGGAYRMRGTIAGAQVTLVPGSWIERPPGYVSVGMHGEVRGAVFAGRMDHASCTTFELRRR